MFVLTMTALLPNPYQTATKVNPLSDYSAGKYWLNLNVLDACVRHFSITKQEPFFFLVKTHKILWTGYLDCNLLFTCIYKKIPFCVSDQYNPSQFQMTGSKTSQ